MTIFSAEHDQRLQDAEQAVEAAMRQVVREHSLTALAWSAVLTQCLFGGLAMELTETPMSDDEDEDDEDPFNGLNTRS